MSEMRKLSAYFGCFDGTGKSWAEVEPFFADCFSKDVSIVTVTKSSEKEIGYDEWAAFLQKSLEGKADIEMTKLERVEGGIEYSAILKYPGSEPIPFASIGTFENGKLVKVSPLNK